VKIDALIERDRYTGVSALLLISTLVGYSRDQGGREVHAGKHREVVYNDRDAYRPGHGREVPE
jgi:hypothetical protein